MPVACIMEGDAVTAPLRGSGRRAATWLVVAPTPDRANRIRLALPLNINLHRAVRDQIEVLYTGEPRARN
jgi:hypothetical protein